MSTWGWAGMRSCAPQGHLVVPICDSVLGPDGKRFCPFGYVRLEVFILIGNTVSALSPHPPHSMIELMSDTAVQSESALKSIKVEPTAGWQHDWSAHKLCVARVTGTTESVRITADLSDPTHSLTVNGLPVASGQASQPCSVRPGRTLVPIEITGTDGVARGKYTAKILRPYVAADWVCHAATAPWSPRDSEGELVFLDRFWLLGGYTPELVSDVWSSPDGCNWSQAGSLPSPAGVNIPICLAYDGRMWVTTQDGKFFSSRDGANWTLVTEDAPWKGRYAAGGVVFAGRMWVMGGAVAGRVFNDIWSSTDGAHWKCEVAEAPWLRRQVFGMLAVHRDKLWLVGGGITVYHPFVSYRDVWCSSDGRNWEQVLDEAPWPGRIWSNVVTYRNRLWLLGGFQAEPTWQNFNDVWYSADGRCWHRLETETIWSPRHEFSPYVFDDRLWVVGGNAWPLQNDAWSLHIPGLSFVTQPVIETFPTAGYRYRARADFNASAGPVRYRLLEGPAWLALDADTGIVRGVPPEPADHKIEIEARDEAGETAQQRYTLHVAAPLMF